MAGSEVGRLDEDPLDVVAELVKVADHLVKSEAEVPADVLENDKRWTECGYGVGHVGPQVALILLPEASSGLAERLARVAASDDVHRLDGSPINGGDVAEVRDARESVGEHLARALVDLGHPCGAGTEHFLNGTVEHSSAREQAANGERHGWAFRACCQSRTGRGRVAIRTNSSWVVVPRIHARTAGRFLSGPKVRYVPSAVSHPMAWAYL